MIKKVFYCIIVSSFFIYQGINCLAAERDTYNYELKDSNKVVYRGQTNDPHRRKLEHARDGKDFTHMVIVGNAKTQAGALRFEKEDLQRYRDNHNGENPKYNQTDHG